MGITCDIFLDKPAEGVFKAGKVISGVVKYAIDEQTEYADIVLSLIGEASCYVKKNDDSYLGKETILTRHKNVLNKGANQTILVPKGFYEYRFEFVLPKNIPSSYQSRSKLLMFSAVQYKCNITYTIILKATLSSFFSFSRSFKTEVIVYGNVNPVAVDEPNVVSLEKTLLNLLSYKKNVVNLKGYAVKSLLSPGEIAELKFDLINDSDRDVDCVKIELHQRMTLDTKYGKRDVIEKAIDGCNFATGRIAKNTALNFSCAIPILAGLYSIQHCKVIYVDYFVKATVVLPLPHFDASLEIPIVIGERCSDTEAVRVLDDFDDEDEKPPPSYWESMAEVKSMQ